MPDSSSVCVCIPTLNEAGTIGQVIDGFRNEGFNDILVVDGGSTDTTREVADEHGARVITQSKTGKGHAVREAVSEIEKPYVVLVDGDTTYDPSDVHDLLAPLDTGDADHVIANRFANLENGALTRLNYAGNRLINAVFRFLYREDYTDILSGYRAFRRDAFVSLDPSADGFEIEADLAVEYARTTASVEVVPTTYRPRPNDSEENLHPIIDGGRILALLYGRSKALNPLAYYGLPAVALYVLGLTPLLSGIPAVAAVSLAIPLLTVALLSDFLCDTPIGSSREESDSIDQGEV